MTRISKLAAAALALVVLVAPGLMTAGTAAAAPWTGTRAQAIQFVIQRHCPSVGCPTRTAAAMSTEPAPARVPGDDAAPVDLSAAQTTDPLNPAPVPIWAAAPVAAPVAHAQTEGRRLRLVRFDRVRLAGVGIKMPRSSGEQYKVGRKVLPSQALPGDLIFWGPEGSQSVALFIGNGQMVGVHPAGRDGVEGAHRRDYAVPGAGDRPVTAPGECGGDPDRPPPRRACQTVRMAQITLRGNAINTLGELPAVGTQGPAFTLTGTDLGTVSNEQFR
jgi:hypothetical protein